MPIEGKSSPYQLNRRGAPGPAPRIVVPAEPAPTTMRLDTEIGSLVRFLGTGGYPAQLEAARNALVVGRDYEVLDVRVGGWESSVRIAEGWFNTVMFENAPDPENAPAP